MVDTPVKAPDTAEARRRLAALKQWLESAEEVLRLAEQGEATPTQQLAAKALGAKLDEVAATVRGGKRDPEQRFYREVKAYYLRHNLRLAEEPFVGERGVSAERFAARCNAVLPVIWPTPGGEAHEILRTYDPEDDTGLDGTGADAYARALVSRLTGEKPDRLERARADLNKQLPGLSEHVGPLPYNFASGRWFPGAPEQEPRPKRTLKVAGITVTAEWDADSDLLARVTDPLHDLVLTKIAAAKSAARKAG